MRSPALSLFVFMTLVVLVAHGKKQEKEGKCEYYGETIQEGETVTVKGPCEQVKCKKGKVQVLKTCPRMGSDVCEYVKAVEKSGLKCCTVPLIQCYD
uniref:Single domain-containing protein n=1 Tax=Amblyomma maculatum TaxID=34609 RepID=G3MST4_AMBMU